MHKTLLRHMIAKDVFSFVGRYGIVGVLAASIHATVLILLLKFLPLWLSNLSGFLTASITSYLGHSLFTFRPETRGQRFARRWLLLQFSVNLSVSALLPIALNQWSDQQVTKLILVFTPTVINAIIWKRAAIFSNNRQRKLTSIPFRHADDLGLSKASNKAILSLASQGHLDSASLIINGTAVPEAIKGWEDLKKLPLSLHLCLTEGPALSEKNQVSSLVNNKGILKKSFVELLLSSFLPRRSSLKRALEEQLELEITKQIELFKSLTGSSSISLDGHQHVHLVPIVLNILLKNNSTYKINWIRTTMEPLPTGLPLRYWLIILKELRWLKWSILQVLSLLAKPKIYKALLATNSRFSGVLFTGRMVKPIINLAWRELQITHHSPDETPPILLTHPSIKIELEEDNIDLAGFHISHNFISSSWRQQELESLRELYKV